MLVVNLLLSFSALVGLFLGLFILASNPRKTVNRALAGFLFAIFVWLFANLLTNISSNPDVALWFARSTLIGACLVPFAFVVFCMAYTNPEGLNFKKVALVFIGPLYILVTTPTDLNIVSIEAYGKNTVTGVIYYVLVPIAVLYFAWGLILLIRYYGRTKKVVEKAQIRYIFAGIILTLIPIVITNGIMPTLGNNSGILYGPNVVIVLAVFMSIAIVKHRLLDIRLIVARSIAYILLFTSVIGIYTALTFGIAGRIFGDNQFSQKVVPILMAIFVAFTMQPLRKFFDKTTNRFFYQDAYDPQQFLDQFNKTLISTYDLGQLLHKSAEIIEENLKPAFCAFAVRDSEGATYRLITAGENKKILSKDILAMSHSFRGLSEKIVIFEALDDRHGQLQDIMQLNDLAVVAKLSNTISKQDEGVGFLLLGHKKSGNLYSPQDVKQIEIIANELVIAVQNALHTEEIENFNKTLQMKVDDATRKLRRTNEKLKALDETKDDFISMASHQLRTPLTSIKGYISMVMEGDAGKISKTQQEMLTQAFFSSQRMVYLISDLLNVSRLKTGKFIIEPARVNLATMVEQEINQLKEAAAARNLTLSFDRPDEFPDVMLDETKTRQVIMNFADNAIYYTPAGGHVRVRLVDTPTTVEFRVEDNGIGVAKSDQPHLFTKFYRAGNARKARPDGTGLGLFMAKKVIVAEEGSLIFTSEEGKGSTFGFVFSKAKVLAPPLAASTPEKPAKAKAATK